MHTRMVAVRSDPNMTPARLGAFIISNKPPLCCSSVAIVGAEDEGVAVGCGDGAGATKDDRENDEVETPADEAKNCMPSLLENDPKRRRFKLLVMGHLQTV